ncbi:MAG: endo-1,4-beta-xylanase [Armatimonadaceae bacterium]
MGIVLGAGGTAWSPVYADRAETKAEIQQLPPGSVSLLPEGELAGFSVGENPEFVQSERVSVSGQPFREAFRITTKKRPPNPWTVQLTATPTGAVQSGDTMLLSFYVRTVKGQAETGEARTAVVFEKGGEPYTKSLDAPVNIPAKGWKRYDIPFKAVENLPAGEARVHFRLGVNPQTFEVGGISLRKWGPEVALSALPRTRVTYAGMEENAAWRKAAAARIEKIRKGDLKVRVVDATGKPIPEVAVRVRMKQHAFPFGTAVATGALVGTGPDNEKYRQTVAELYNWVVIENNLKWPQWEQNREQAIQAVEWLNNKNIKVRGHNLVWPSWQNLPDDLEKLKDDPKKLDARIRSHIVDITAAMRGKLVEWDVINETFTNHDLMDILGQDEMVSWFKLAKATDPRPLLYLNDYPPLDGSDRDNPHLNHFFNTIQFLQKKGAPIEGIGFQGHFGGNVIPPERILSGLDRFSTFNLPIMITEFDMNTQDEQLQAAYMRDFMTACFSHPSCAGIMMWGFWEGRHWMPDAALYRRDWTIKPHGQVWLDLVKKQWWSNADGKTNRSGEFAMRGFLGNYEIVVERNGKTEIVSTPLTSIGTTVNIVMN